MTARPKVSEACLSAYEIGRFVAGAVSPQLAPALQAHINACEHCRQRVNQEREALALHQQRELPAWLTQSRPVAPRRPRAFSTGWLAAGAGAAALAAAALWVLRPAPSPDDGVRSKGALQVSVSVMRGEQLVYHAAKAGDIEALRAGDRLRLAVSGAPWVVVEAKEAEGWREYYRGPRPSDGWLPIGVKVNGGQARGVSHPGLCRRRGRFTL